MATYKLFKTPNGKFLKTASGKFLAQSTPFVGSEPTGDYYLAKDKIIGSSSGYYAIHHTYDIWATGDLSWLLCPVGMWQNDSENPAFWSYSGDYAFLANQETQADRASFASTFQELSNGVDIGKGGAVVGVEDGGDGSHVLLKEVSTIMPWAELATLFDNLRQTSTAFAGGRPSASDWETIEAAIPITDIQNIVSDYNSNPLYSAFRCAPLLYAADSQYGRFWLQLEVKYEVSGDKTTSIFIISLIFPEGGNGVFADAPFSAAYKTARYVGQTEAATGYNINHLTPTTVQHETY